MRQSEKSAPSRTFRQASAVVLGLLFAGSLLVLGVTGLAGGLGDGLAWVFLGGACLVTALLVWPSVRIDQHGVHLDNVGTVTHVPWHLVDDCETRWNLKVWTLEKAYTAWAVSAARRGHLPAHHMQVASLNPAYIGRPEKIDQAAAAGVERHARKVHAASVADRIEQAKREYDQGVADGLVSPTTGPVRRTVSPVSVGLLAAALVCTVVGAVLL